jgi:rare lipoprotein A
LKRWNTVVMAGAMLALLAACATDRPRPSASSGQYKVGSPYQIDGVWYYPKEDPFYDETGIASWYGEDFHGKSTANGETYDMAALTAAHRTLPLPTIVRVTNLQNGKSILLRVNDRGPYARGRIIDVSKHAADLLGFQRNGTARVRVQYEGRATGAGADVVDGAPPASTIRAAPLSTVTSADIAPPPGAQASAVPVIASPIVPDAKAVSAAGSAEMEPDGTVTTLQVPAATQIWVQLGAFSARSNAERLVSGSSASGRPQISQVMRGGKPIYRVRFGPYTAVEDADAMLDKVISAGQNGAQIVVE